MSSVMMMNMDLKTQGKICLIDLGFSFRAFGHSTAYALSKLRRVFANPDFSSDLFLAVFCDIDLRSVLSSFPVSLSFVFPGYSQKVTLDPLFCHHQFSFFLGLPTFFVSCFKIGCSWYISSLFFWWFFVCRHCTC